MEFPIAGADVDGLKVELPVPNMNSISASLNEYEVLDGIRAVPISEFGDCSPRKVFYDARDIDKVKVLAHAIDLNGWIKPLIVVQDREGLYLLEGLHRLSALCLLGKTELPALIVKDLESLNEEVHNMTTEKSKSVVQQRLMGMAYAYKKASPEERKKMQASLTVKKMAHTMSKKDLEDFASTKHDGLPVKKEEIQGAEEERSEHDPQYDWLYAKMKSFYSANKRFPTKKEFDEYESEFFNKVAKSHTDKFPDYYDALDKMEANLKRN